MKVQSRLRELVAEEVRALLARRRLNGAKLAAAIDRSEMYVSRRLRGETSFDLDDLEKIAEVLDVPVGALLPRGLSQGESIQRWIPLPERTPQPVIADRPTDNRPPRHQGHAHADRSVKVATRPVGHAGSGPRRTSRLAT